MPEVLLNNLPLKKTYLRNKTVNYIQLENFCVTIMKKRNDR